MAKSRPRYPKTQQDTGSIEDLFAFYARQIELAHQSRDALEATTRVVARRGGAVQRVLR